MKQPTRHFTGQEQCSTCAPSTAVWKATMTTTELRFHEVEGGAVVQSHRFRLDHLKGVSYTIHFLSDGVSSSLAPGEGSREATLDLWATGFAVNIGTTSKIVFSET